MKFILVCLFVFFGFSVNDSVDKNYSKTGHEQFSEIVMVDEDTFIIKDKDDDFIDTELAKLKAKLFGKREETFNEYSDATYVSKVIFSRSNKTREEYTFSYDTSTITYQSVSVTVNGSLSTKGVLKDKSKELTVNADGEIEKETENYTKNSEEGKLKVVIYPNKKVTLRIVGDCKVSNGVSKSFFLGICTKKGAWEVINVTSTCYELIEEDA